MRGTSKPPDTTIFTSPNPSSSSAFRTFQTSVAFTPVGVGAPETTIAFGSADLIGWAAYLAKDYATFRKLIGPTGGGYGIIVRDQSPTLRDGASQDGRYVVLEVGDKGEVGMWRREADHFQFSALEDSHLH